MDGDGGECRDQHYRADQRHQTAPQDAECGLEVKGLRSGCGQCLGGRRTASAFWLDRMPGASLSIQHNAPRNLARPFWPALLVGAQLSAKQVTGMLMHRIESIRGS